MDGRLVDNHRFIGTHAVPVQDTGAAWASGRRNISQKTKSTHGNIYFSIDRDCATLS